MLAIIKGQTPYPIPLLDSAEKKLIWTVTSECWAQSPSDRPSMEQIIHSLQHHDVAMYLDDFGSHQAFEYTGFGASAGGNLSNLQYSPNGDSELVSTGELCNRCVYF